jgi:acyl-homoserine-lactone acylase
MRRLVRRSAVGAIFVVALWSSSAYAAKRDVTVTRDSAGIPHIVAKDFRSLGYGEGYSYAEDNLCIFADTIVTLRAQRAKYFGPDALSYVYAGATDPNIKSDFFWQRIRDSGVVRRLTRAKAPIGPTRQARDLFRGWAEGYNAFLRSRRFRDRTCKGQPWVKPITTGDLFYRGLQISTLPSSGRFISGMFDAQPPAASARAAGRSGAPTRASLARLNDRFGDTSAAGSNGIGLGSRGTAGRDGMVLANPHFPWRGTERFWLVHLTVPGSYDVMGGTLGGFPPVGIGFNKDIAWTHTISTARRFVIFQLKLAPGDPTSYLVDGQPVRMQNQTVTVNGQTHDYYLTRYGVVLNVPDAGYAWSTDTAYALADVEAENIRGANQYIEMGRARNVRELARTEEHFLGIPTFNTVAADRSGRAFYGDIGAIPNVPKTKIDACTPSGAPQLVFAAARAVTLDGSRSECDLKRDRGAVAPDIFGPSRLPKLFRRDYVANENDSYWLSNPAKPLEGFSPIIGLERTPQNLRTRQGKLMTQARLGTFTIGRLQAMWQNDRNHGAELTAKPLAAACSSNPQVTLIDASIVDISEACPVLASYGQTGNLDDPGAWLFNEWLRRAPSASGRLFKDPFDPSKPLTTPAVLNTDDPAVLQALGAAVTDMRARNVPLNATLRRTQFAARGKRKIPIHGCFQCYQAITTSNGQPSQNAPYGEVIAGSSMVLTTELTKRGPRSEGILTYSQATDPTSRWFANQTGLFSRKRWVPMRFTAAQLARDRGARRTKLP